MTTISRFTTCPFIRCVCPHGDRTTRIKLKPSAFEWFQSTGAGAQHAANTEDNLKGPGYRKSNPEGPTPKHRPVHRVMQLSPTSTSCTPDATGGPECSLNVHAHKVQT
ncbi:unnamed protein product [Lota lota]